MKPEDFDGAMREQDPARDLTKMTESELQEIAVAAIAAEPVAVKAASKWNKGAIAAAAAALLLVPTLNGAFTADAPPILRVNVDGQTAAPAGALAQQESSLSGDQAVKMIYPGYWNFYKLQLADGVVVEVDTAPAYENKALANAAEIAQDIANYFDLGKLKFDSEYDSYVINPNGEGPSLWAYTDGPWANYSYYNNELDPWRECYTSVDPAVEEGSSTDGSVEEGVTEEYVPCEPAPAENLPSDSEAKQMALKFWKSFGLDTSGLKLDVWSDDWSVYVSASGPDDFYAANYSVSFVANGEIQSSYGSLTYLAEIGEYDLVDAQAAIDRANAFTDQQIAYYEENDWYGGGIMPMVKDGATTEPAPAEDSDTAVSSDDVSPSEEEYVAPKPEVLDFVVTKIELSWQMYYAENGQALYLPTYNFFGYTLNADGSKGDEYTEWPISTTIAVVDEQIDIDSFYGYWLGYGRSGVMAID